ncbi:uncharacterized protein RCO7_04548 [Rhynchosporium graminicola]|uniref:BTB domain-containing protein n=1 Tax=Rhynchosporium graminicola TaxID=2792576 RepID=A0A1E1JSW4_9HELO|nr:uncharacterized protein RCO7_04548 [Rhynchosporium commune]
MPPKKVIPWTAEQIAFIMEESNAGVKPVEIGKEVKVRWPQKEIGKGTISSLITRQNKKKKKSTGQGISQSSRDSSNAPPVSARSEVEETIRPSSTVGSPQVPELFEPRSLSPILEVLTPKSSPKIEPFSSFETPPPHQSPPSTWNNLMNMQASPHITSNSPTVKLSATVFSSSSGIDESETPTEPFPEFNHELAEQILAEDEFLSRSPELFDPSTITGYLMRQKRSLPSDRLLLPVDKDIDEEVGDVSIENTEAEFRAEVSATEKSEAEADIDKAFQEEQSNKVTIAEGIEIEATDIAEPTDQVPSKSLVVEEIEVKVPEIDEPSHQVPTKITAIEKVEVEAPEISEPDSRLETELAVTEYIEGEGEVSEPASSLQEVNSGPTNSHQITTSQPKFNVSDLITVASLPEQLSDKMAGRTPSPTPPPSPVRMPTFADLLGREIIVLYVGPKRKEFPVHGNLLRINSSVFRDFVFPLNDAGQGEHYLADSDPSAVSVIINWLYRQHSFLHILPGADEPNPAPGATDNDGSKHFHEAITRAIGIYILAEEIAIEPLKDLVVTALGQAYYQNKAFPSSKDIITVYSRTDVHSCLRKYMARSYQAIADLEDTDIVAAGWTVEEVDEVVAAVPALFKDYRALNRNRKGVESTELSLDLVCSYHVHDGTEACVSDGLNFRGMTV